MDQNILSYTIRFDFEKRKYMTMKRLIHTSALFLIIALMISINNDLKAQSFPVGTLPPGKTIVITYEVDVNTDACPTGTVPGSDISNQSNVSGSNFATVQTDDPDIGGASDPTLTELSALTLGDLVYLDNNRNGEFDGGDVGLNDVLLNLYADDGDGMLTMADGSPIESTTTTGGGFYSFTVCPGDYIVEVDLSNFTSGGALYNSGAPLISSPAGGAPDPNDNVNNDDNGDPVTGFGVASFAITLDYGTEPIDDGDTDPNTNLTLDFGFKTPTTVTIDDVTMVEGTGGGTTAFEFTVTRNDNSEAFDLTVNTIDGTASSLSDFVGISNGTVSFSEGGSLTATVTVLVNHDNIVEDNETFEVVLSGAPAGIAIPNDTGLGTITNDDTANLTLSGGVSQLEGTDFTIVASLSAPVQGGFSVEYFTNDGIATLGDNDYSDNDGTLIFTGNIDESQSFVVSSIDDDKVELDETFTGSLGAVSGTSAVQVAAISIAGSPQTATILNDDDATISIIGNVNQFEANSPQTFTLELSNPVDVDVTVLFSTLDNTATVADNDYVSITDQIVTFTANSTAAQSVPVSINDDNKVEADEIFNVAIDGHDASGRDVELGTSSATGTIVNDDSSVVTLSGGTSQEEGNTGTTSFVFSATLSNPVQGGFTAHYSTSDGIATLADNDYVENIGSLAFTGTTDEEQTITVLVNGDLNIEDDETFQVVLDSLTGGVSPGAVTITDSPQIGTILNDELDWGDAPESYSTTEASNGARHFLTPGGLTLGASVTADLDGQPSAGADADTDDGVTLPSAIVIGTNASITVNAATPGLLNAWVDFNGDGDWDEMIEQIFTDQAVVAGDNSLSFAVPAGATLGNSFARFRLSSDSGLSYTGFANDGEVEDYAIEIVNTQFSIDDPTVIEGDAGTTNLVFTVSRNVNVNDCSVDYSITGGMASVADSDFQMLVPGTLNFSEDGAFSQTITVVVNGDTKVELDETVEITLSNPVDAGILDGLGVGTIVNDDAATISINSPSIIEGDAGTSNLEFTITLDYPVDGDVGVDARTLDGLATAADMDFVDLDETVTILANTLSQTISVVINGDCTIEPDEDFSLELSSIDAAGRNVTFSGASSTLEGTGTIINDDVLPEVVCPSDNTYNTDPDLCAATITLELPGIVSSCGTTSFDFRYRSVDDMDTPTSPYSSYESSTNNTISLAKDRYQVEWRLTDGSGEVTCTYFIEIFDMQTPTSTCPDTQFIDVDENCEAILPDYTSMAMSDDNCGGNTIVQMPTPGTIISEVGSESITLIVADENGNSSSCSFNVEKEDNIPPVVMCQNDTVNLNGETSLLLIPEDLVEATDNCGIDTIEASPSTVLISQIGETVPVTLTVTDLSGNSNTCVSQVYVSGLPPGWSQNENGVNCEDGNLVEYEPTTEVWTMSSTGCYYGPPYTSDELAYAQYNLCGNGEIIAQVTGISGSGFGWAGISMRETSDAGSKKVQLTTNLSNFARREARTVTGGQAVPKQFFSPNRFWLRLVRNGNQFIGYTSANGQHWFQVMVANVDMNSCIQLGLVLTNYNSSGTVNATFANVSTSGSSVPLTNFPSDLAHNSEYDYTVYPNPSNGEILLELGDYVSKELHLELIDMYGRTVFVKELNFATEKERIDLNSFTNGIYFLKASSPGLPDNIKKVILLKN